MTKQNLVNTVLENCDDIYANRKLVNNIVDSTFEVIAKSSKNRARSLARNLELSECLKEKQGKGAIQGQENRFK